MCTPTEPQSLSSFHPITTCMLSLSAPNHCQLLRFKCSFYCQSAVIHLTLLCTTFTVSYDFGDYLYILLLPLLCLCDSLQRDVNLSGDLLLDLAQSRPVQEHSYRFYPVFFLSGWVPVCGVSSKGSQHFASHRAPVIPASGTGKPWRWRRISCSFFSFCRGGYSIYWDAAWP